MIVCNHYIHQSYWLDLY